MSQRNKIKAQTVDVAWLRARYDERERTARTAGGDRWRYDDSGIYHEDESKRPGPFVAGVYGYLDEEEGEHIADNDPAFVLADLDAKRRILDEYEKALDRRRRHPEDLASAGALLEMVSVVKLLALPFAKWPGYRSEWAPDT